MTQYILRRLLLMIPVALLVTIGIFVLVRLEASCGGHREIPRSAPAFVESGKAYCAVAGSLDFVKSGFRFSRNAVSASLASGERSRTA